MDKAMKAVVYTRYGGPEVLTFGKIARPTPKADEVLIKIHSSSVVAGDMRMRKADPFLARLYNGIFKPKKINVLGFEIAGEVAEIGKDVTEFTVGDKVFACCSTTFGGYAEYKVISQNGIIAKMPKNLSYEQAATVPIGAIAALNLIKMGGVHKGAKVLIVGAAGSIGTYAVQIAKNMGAQVTGTCSTGKSDFVRSLGAQEAIDYKKEDYLNAGTQYDIICDTAGKMYTGIGQSKYNRILKFGGRYVSSMMNLDYKKSDLLELKQMLENGSIKPIIDKVFSINDIQSAHEYFESGMKTGNVPVTMDFK